MYKRTPRSDRKFNKSKEWLYEEYVIKNRDRKEIAKECGLTLAGLKNALSKYEIYKPEFNIPIEQLKKYLEEGKSVTEISKIFHCGKTSIYRRMRTNNLSINYKPDYKQYDDVNDEIICSLYLNGMSPNDIGNKLGISRAAVKNHLIHCGVSLRGCVEAQIGYRCGEKHPNWQGGVTSIYMRLRTAFEVQLKPKAQKRDNNTCQFCGKIEDLCVHHKRPFREIVDEIINEHPELDIKKDVNILYDIAVRDDRFTDLSNLITCCNKCHYKLHGSKK